MNLFVWGKNLRERSVLEFILRHEYNFPFEPGILKGYMVGNNFPDMLFKLEGMEVMGDIACGLSVTDFIKLDRYHALDEGIHKRLIAPIHVMREGNIVEIPVHVYSAAEKFSKVRGGRIR